MFKKSKDRDIKSWLKCPRCCSTNILYNKLTNDYWCRRCGANFIADFDKKEVFEKSSKKSVVD